MTLLHDSPGAEPPLVRVHQHDLGITKRRVLSAPRQLLGIAAFGREITGYEE